MLINDTYKFAKLKSYLITFVITMMAAKPAFAQDLPPPEGMISYTNFINSI